MIQRSMALELSVVAHACGPSMKEGGVGRSEAWGQLGL